MCDACWLGVCACVCVLCWSVLVRVALWEGRTYTTLGTLEGTSLVHVIRVLPGVNPGRHPTESPSLERRGGVAVARAARRSRRRRGRRRRRRCCSRGGSCSGGVAVAVVVAVVGGVVLVVVLVRVVIAALASGQLLLRASCVICGLSARVCSCLLLLVSASVLGVA